MSDKEISEAGFKVIHLDYLIYKNHVPIVLVSSTENDPEIEFTIKRKSL